MWLLAGLLWLQGCTKGDLIPIQGTTIRVAEPQSDAGERDLAIRIFGSADDCGGGRPGEVNMELCLPYVDRSTGQVRVAFEARIADENWPVPLTEDDILLSHKSYNVTRTGENDYKLIPHDPTNTSQLFVLLIDVSGSMGITDPSSNRTRMDKLKAALLRTDVVDAFFPGDVQTAVLPMVFNSGLPRAVVPETLVVRSKKDYREAIKKVNVEQGYTHLYDGVAYTAATVLAMDAAKTLINNERMIPTIIAMTDGFNNEDDKPGKKAKDICADNAPRLERLAVTLDKLRRETNPAIRPSVYTVGLGRAAWGRRRAPDPRKNPQELLTVSPRALCGNYSDMIIDGQLEKRGVDNVAMEWIAAAGGGHSYIRNDTNGLAEAFKDAARQRYRWFELRYKVDPFHLRRSFETKIRLVSMFSSEATIRFYPSGWLDAPPGIPDAEGWTQPAPFSRTLVVLLPVIGAILSLSYLPAAMFNVRRALFSRVVRRKK